MFEIRSYVICPRLRVKVFLVVPNGSDHCSLLLDVLISLQELCVFVASRVFNIQGVVLDQKDRRKFVKNEMKEILRSTLKITKNSMQLPKF